MGDYKQDGEAAKEIAQYLPYFPFKGIPRFYDIGGFLAEPAVFQRIVDIFVARYREIGIDSICGLDARGFVLGPPIALALKKPFIMMRKKVRGTGANGAQWTFRSKPNSHIARSIRIVHRVKCPTLFLRKTTRRSTAIAQDSRCSGIKSNRVIGVSTKKCLPASFFPLTEFVY